MAITYRYSRVPRADGTLHHAPFIPVFLRAQSGKMLRFVALVDSGADETVVPKDLAETLGLEDGEELETGGIGGKIKVRKSRLPMMVKGSRECYSFYLPVLTIQDQKADVPLLLGRNGFFEHFHITFKQQEERLVLKKVPIQTY